MPRAFLVPWGKQPRKRFDAEKLGQLAESLKAVGQLQALLVRPLAEAAGEATHEIIVGERRWRAAEQAGLDYLEVRVVELEDKEALELSVMENVHRDDLDVMEEAEGYAAMVKAGWTVAEIAQRSGRSGDMIYELLQLPKLDAGTKQELEIGTISRKVAEALGRIEDLEKRAEALREVVTPTYQREPLPRDAAMRLITHDYLNPQKAAKEWAGRLKSLKKTHPGMTILSLADYEENSSDYERANDVIPNYYLAVHARDKECPETWEDLAKRHGGEFFVTPDEDGEPEVMVLRNPLMEAERTVGETDALACIFPLKGKGRHEQGLQNQRNAGAGDEEDDDEEEGDREAARDKQIEEGQERKRKAAQGIYKKLCHAKEAWKGGKNPELGEKCRELVEWALSGNYLFSMKDAAKLYGVDVETLGDGDEEQGADQWAANVAVDKGPGGMVFLIMCNMIAEMIVAHCDFDHEMNVLEQILGADEGT
jgi:ParB/RepB/Spo0J family partition protein